MKKHHWRDPKLAIISMRLLLNPEVTSNVPAWLERFRLKLLRLADIEDVRMNSAQAVSNGTVATYKISIMVPSIASAKVRANLLFTRIHKWYGVVNGEAEITYVDPTMPKGGEHTDALRKVFGRGSD